MGDRYRAVFQTVLGVDQTVDVAWRHLADWLADGGFDAGPFGAGVVVLAPGTELSYGHADDGHGGGTHRWTLNEDGPFGQRWTILTVHGPVPAPWLDDDPDAQCSWVWVERDRDTATARGDTAGSNAAAAGAEGGAQPVLPSAEDLTRRLLAPIQASDGPAVLRPEPVPVHAKDVDGLITVLCDPERRLPVVVASACARRPAEEWERTVRTVTGPLAGLGGIYVLDRTATDRFCRQLGEDHWVNGGAIRTYHPLVDPASRADAKRHPVISLRRLEEDLERAAGRIARELRRCVAQLELPRGLTVLLPVVGGTFDRSGTADAADAGAARQPASGRVRGRLPIRAEGTAARDGRSEGRSEPRRSEESRLRRRRAKDSAPDGEQLPTSFEHILQRFSELTHVVFTGDARSLHGLDVKQRNASWVRSAWEALLALDDYATARTKEGFAGDFRDWCEQRIDDARTINPRRVARRESVRVRTNARMREPRMLPVPSEVDSSGRVYMEKHVRIANTGRMAPRLHYFDDTAASGHVYVGYIGPHLRNTLTN